MNLSGKNLISKSKTTSKTQINNNNESLSSSLIISNQDHSSKNMNLNEKLNIQSKIIENTKNNLKEEFKRIAKDKNYSKSIDGNIPKTKYAQYQMNNFPASDTYNNAAKIKLNNNMNNNTKIKK